MDRSQISDVSDLFGDSQWGDADATNLTLYTGEIPEGMPTVDHMLPPRTPKFRLLDTIDTASPVDSVFSYAEMTQSPLTPVQNVGTFQKQQTLYNRYPLGDDPKLNRFVLNGFTLKLNRQMGAGGSAYVYDCTLGVLNDPNTVTNLAIKIPIGKSKCKSIIREASFSLLLKENHYEDVSPFIECFGIYYLNKESFPLFRRMDELPCLLLSKMDMDLCSFIDERKHKRAVGDLKLKREWWWDLFRTLMKSLKILKDLRMVHCDFKTENVMIKFKDDDITPEFKVIDFSSVSFVDAQEEMPDLTYLFSAPELLTYDTVERPNFQTDMFSVGLILLNAATGSFPYFTAAHDQFYQLLAAQGGKPLEWLTAEDSLVLKENPVEANIIKKILVERSPLDTFLSL